MKIGNRQFTVPNEFVVVIPRPQGDIAFKARAVLDYKEFDALCPVPKPPAVQRPGKETSFDNTDPDFLKKLGEWSNQKTSWTVLKSLEATEGLSWERVIPNKPETWGFWKDELQAAFFTNSEIDRVFLAVLRANSLDEQYLEQARQNFLLGEAQRVMSSSQKDVPNNTQSGTPASA